MVSVRLGEEMGAEGFPNCGGGVLTILSTTQGKPRPYEMCISVLYTVPEANTGTRCSNQLTRIAFVRG